MKSKMNKKKFRQGKFIPQNRSKYIGSSLPYFRSSWERTFMDWCDKSPTVIEWCSEQPKVPYLNPLTGTKWNYHPDFVIKIRDSKGIRVEMIEVKPKRETFPPVKSKGKRKSTLMEETKRWIMNSAKWAAAKDYCKRNNWIFKVMYLEDNSFKEAKHIRLANSEKLTEGFPIPDEHN